MTKPSLSLNKKKVTFEGIVTNILSYRHNGSIFSIDHFDNKRTTNIKIKADYNVLPIKPTTGEIWRISGHVENNKMHGQQLVAVDCYRKRPTGNILIQFIAQNNKFAGIGEKKAKYLWATFGEKLYDILDKGDLEILTDNKKGKLNEALASVLIDVWHTYSSETPIIEWLHRHNFSSKLAIVIREFWGKDAIAKITLDPYKMLAFESWKKVDAIALQLGVTNDDIRRQQAAIEATLYEHYDRGNTAITESTLKCGFNKKTGLGTKIFNALNININARIIHIANKNLYQSLGAYSLEKIIKNRLLSTLKNRGIKSLIHRPHYNEVKLRKFEKNKGISLNHEQKLAIKIVLNNPVSCIIGGAGVGKTTVLESIFNQLNETTIIYQVALTGRAAKRMMEITNHEAKTIALFLFHMKDRKIQDNCFLFIDEASMLDTPNLYRLLKALPDNINICFIGDPYQLPPIGPGLPFKKLTESTHIPSVELVEAHRFHKNSGVLEIANKIRNQSKNIQLDTFSNINSRDYGVSLIETNNISTLIEATIRTYREFNHHGDVQIIAPTNKLCVQINIQLHNEHKETRKYKKLSTLTLHINGVTMTIGDRLLYHSSNNYMKELYNGSLGILTEVYNRPIISIDDKGNENSYIAEANFDDGNIVKLTESDFKNISLGYCITVHKSQGSQFERIIFLCPDSNIIDNTLIYTAVTRAKKQVCIIGDSEKLYNEVTSTPRAFGRCTGLDFCN